MKKLLLNIYRSIVGHEDGWSGEGNEQWYYFLALVINCMLTWWLKPELGIVFTAAAVIHYITVYVYGYKMLFHDSVWYYIVYYLIHTAIFIVCIIFNWKWAILTSLIVVSAYFLAPDCTGNNIFMRAPIDYTIYFGAMGNIAIILLFHTILFTAFVVIALNLPIVLWIRIKIIVTCMILHPIIDLFQGDGISISEVTNESYETIVQTIEDIKSKKNN